MMHIEPDWAEISRQQRAQKVFGKTDNVNQPMHYTHGGIETIDYLQAKLSKDEFVGYLKGNILKYMSRANMKNGIEDYRKAQWYLNKLLEVSVNET